MPAITSVDLNNAKLDVDHIAAIATSTQPTATDRLGNSKLTMQGATDRINTAVYTATAFTNRGTWTPSTIYAVKDLVKESSTWYVCVVAHTSAGAFATDQASKWRVYQGVTSGDLGASTGIQLVGGVISVDTTINVPAQYATIGAAMSYLMSKTIAQQAVVTIAVADGTYLITAGFNLNHANGNRIRLVGNEATPANCLLICTSAPTFDCLFVSGGHTFSLIAGFKIDLSAKALAANNATAILALDGAQINEVRNCIINNWYYQIAERSGARIFAHDCTLSNGGDVMVWAFCGGSIRGYNLTVSGAIDVANNLGYGFQGEYGGVVEVSNSSATGCQRGGFAALSNGTGRYYSCTSSGNIGSGFVAQGGGVIEANGSSSTGNTRYGIEFFGSGTCTGLSTNSGNTLGIDNGGMYIDQGPLGARLAGNGPVRIDTNDTDPIYFNSSGGLQFQVKHTNAVTSWPSVTGGASGGNPVIEANTGAAGVDITLRGKGTGAVLLASSQANYFRFTGAPSTQPANLRPEGSDTDIDLQLSGKGAGAVRFGVFSVTGDTATNGYITIKDFAGNTIKLATVA